MRDLAVMVAVTCAALVIIAATIFAGGDRSLFVPVPEVVVENFTREITTRRFDLALKYLASGRRRSESPQTVAARFMPLLEAVGKVNRVETEPRWTTDERAAASATVEGDNSSLSFDFFLVRENGVWKIDGLPDLH